VVRAPAGSAGLRPPVRQAGRCAHGATPLICRPGSLLTGGTTVALSLIAPHQAPVTCRAAQLRLRAR
jgi:hypothetical protein